MNIVFYMTPPSPILVLMRSAVLFTYLIPAAIFVLIVAKAAFRVYCPHGYRISSGLRWAGPMLVALGFWIVACLLTMSSFCSDWANNTDTLDFTHTLFNIFLPLDGLIVLLWLSVKCGEDSDGEKSKPEFRAMKSELSLILFPYWKE